MMLDQASVGAAAARSVAHLRRAQGAEGSWLAERRSLELCLAYGTALVAVGHDPRSARMQDLCDEVERQARPDGGFAACHDAVWFLRRCRPSSALLPAAERYLARHAPAPRPTLLLTRWILDPAGREAVLATRPPPRLGRLASRRLGPRLDRLRLGASALGDARAPGLLERRLLRPLLGWSAWPDPEELDGRDPSEEPSPPLVALPTYAAFLALQLRAGDRPLGRGVAKTRRYVVPYLERHLLRDGQPHELLFAAPLLECLRALGRYSDADRLAAAIERVEYRAGGWLRGTMVGSNVLETAQGLQALLESGVPTSDEAVATACDFLQAARAPQGLWSASWQASQGGDSHRDIDPGASGAALQALALAGSPHRADRREEVIDRLFRFQDAGGAIRPVTASSQARVLLAARDLGLHAGDDRMRRGLAWLRRAQDQDGSWSDPGIAGKVYGTAQALEALVQLGEVAVGDPAVERAINLLKRTQNADGGWGFDRHGSRNGRSAAEDTALAVETLSRWSREAARPMSAIEGGVRWLLQRQERDGGWAAAELDQEIDDDFGAEVGNSVGSAGAPSSLAATLFATRALAAFAATHAAYLPTVPQLIRNVRIAERRAQRAAAASDAGAPG